MSVAADRRCQRSCTQHQQPNDPINQQFHKVGTDNVSTRWSPPPAVCHRGAPPPTQWVVHQPREPRCTRDDHKRVQLRWLAHQQHTEPVPALAFTIHYYQ